MLRSHIPKLTFLPQAVIDCSFTKPSSSAPQLGMGLHECFPIYAGVLAGLIWSRSCTSSHSCCEFKCAMAPSSPTNTTSQQSYTFSALRIFLPSLPTCSLGFRWRGIIYVLLRAEKFIVSYSLHIGQLWIFVLTSIYYKRSVREGKNTPIKCTYYEGRKRLMDIKG